MRLLQLSVSWLLPSFSLLFPIKAVVLSSPADPTAIESFHFLSQWVAPLGVLDPARFRVEIHYGQLTLPATSVLMNAVDAMVQLALSDWNGRMGSKTFQLDIPRYSNVEIFISAWDPTPGATLQNKFAVHGLFEVVLSILSDPIRRFKSVQSTFFYDNVQVGWLMIRKTPARAPVSASHGTNATVLPYMTFQQATQSLDEEGPTPALVGTTALGAPAWDDSRLQVRNVRGLDTFTIYEMFFTCIAWIKTMAVHDRTERVQDFTVIIDTPPITAAGQPIAISFRNVNSPPRTAARPPYFQWEWLIKAFGQLPRDSLEQANFKDVVHMALRVDNVPVGEGYIVRRQADLGKVRGTSDNTTAT